MWHGAGWNFLLWGGLHGCYLAVNHLWRNGTRTLGAAIHTALRPANAVLTFGAVVFAWVFFRSPTLVASGNVLKGMTGFTHASLPGEMGFWIPQQPGTSLGIAYDGAGLTFATLCLTATILLVTYGTIFLATNTMQIFGYDARSDSPAIAPPRIGPVVLRAVYVGAAFWISCFGILGAAPSKFLYFQF